MDEHQTFVAERSLWAAVLVMAIKDAFSRRGIVGDDARHFILQDSRWFRQVCDMAGVNPEWVRSKISRTLDDQRAIAHIINIGKRLEKRK